LGPPEAGAIFRSFVTYGGATTTVYITSVETTLWVGGSVSTSLGYNTFYVDQAAFEFYLDPASVPTTNMTANNFTAKIDGLIVTYSYGSGAMDVDLFDMGDTAEDGYITTNDFDNTRGSRIARRTHMFSQAGTADFNDIDVTAAVRNDLFVGGPQDYSGFILKPNVTAQEKWLIYDDTPTLTINTGVTDLAVSKTVNDTTPDEGQTITYTITLNNNGPAQATSVSITDLLPAGVTYSSDDGSGSYNSGTGVWTVGTINNGASATLNIQATVDADTAGSIITNSVTAVYLDQTDNNATPDDLSEAITVNAASVTDLAVSKTVNDTTPDEGQTITYTITLTNNGPIQATTVSITDLLPAGVTYSSDDGAGSYISGTGVWTVGAINNGASATLNIQATVDAGSAGSTITNLVTAVSLDQTDSNATLDDLSEAITVNDVGGGGGSGGGCFIVNAAR
jgi:uncharacterized repeat protein (TIGR01451 family)